MKKYYLMAIDNCHIGAMRNLGYYYQFTEINYEEMKFYYLRAIADGNDHKAMNNLGYYYQYIEKDYEKMQLYYLMAIKEGNTDAIDNIAYYYRNNYEKLSDLLKPIKKCCLNNACKMQLCSCCSNINDKVVEIIEKVLKDNYTSLNKLK